MPGIHEYQCSNLNQRMAAMPDGGDRRAAIRKSQAGSTSAKPPRKRQRVQAACDRGKAMPTCCVEGVAVARHTCWGKWGKCTGSVAGCQGCGERFCTPPLTPRDQGSGARHCWKRRVPARPSLTLPRWGREPRASPQRGEGGRGARQRCLLPRAGSRAGAGQLRRTVAKGASSAHGEARTERRRRSVDGVWGTLGSPHPRPVEGFSLYSARGRLGVVAPGRVSVAGGAGGRGEAAGPGAPPR